MARSPTTNGAFAATAEIRTSNDWIESCERYWEHQLERIKDRADRIEREPRVNAGHTQPEGEISMSTATESETIHTIDIRKDIYIAASPEIAFEALLEELGPGSQMPDGKPFPMKIEPWPGGRWYRDLGETGGHKYGHLWGHVQVIKAPTLLELTGPMPMSYPALNHVQYRLKAEGDGTRLALVHRALGLIPQEHRDGMPDGWEHGIKRVKELAERKTKGRG